MYCCVQPEQSKQLEKESFDFSQATVEDFSKGFWNEEQDENDQV